MAMFTSMSFQNIAEFFKNKIVNLKPTLTDVSFIGTPLVDLPPFDIDTVLKIISLAKPNSSSIDFIPTKLIKSCPGVLSS